jgi:hypothetical protein
MNLRIAAPYRQATPGGGRLKGGTCEADEE